MHVEDVVRRDRCRLGHPVLAFGPAARHEAERGAQAGPAVELEEAEVVAPGEELHPFGGDALVADGAAGPVRERAKVVQRIHPSRV